MKFLTALGLLFIALKLTHVIAWSWWLVLLPLYAGVAVLLGALVVSALGISILACMGKK